jgi:hypothetical protein
VENETGFRSRRGRDQKETEGLTEDVLRERERERERERSDIRGSEEPNMGKELGHRRHDNRNKARKTQNGH